MTLHAKELGNLDLLRATAVMCVFVAHVSPLGWAISLGHLGHFGVLLFFVHTSLVLMMSLDRTDSRLNPSRAQLAMDFAVRRIFRIYPLSVLTVLIVVACHIPAHPLDPSVASTRGDVISNLLLVQNLTYNRSVLFPLWSLPVEIDMYCLLPLLYFVVRRTRFASIPLWLCGAAAAYAQIHAAHMGRLTVLAYAPCFLAGVMAYDLSRAIPRCVPFFAWPCLIALCIAAYGVVGDSSLTDRMERAGPLSLLLAAAIPACYEMRSAALKLVCHTLAKYSYGIYLSHSIAMWVVLRFLGHYGTALKIAAVVALTAAASVTAYHLLEKPMIDMGAHVAERMRRRRAIAVSQAA